MKKKQAYQIWSSYLLMMTILFHFGFACFHVFTTHGFHHHDVIETGDEEITVAEFGQCEFCTKLCNKLTSLIVTPEFNLSALAVYDSFGLLKEKCSKLRLLLHFQRGPPYTFKILFNR